MRIAFFFFSQLACLRSCFDFQMPQLAKTFGAVIEKKRRDSPQFSPGLSRSLRRHLLLAAHVNFFSLR